MNRPVSEVNRSYNLDVRDCGGLNILQSTGGIIINRVHSAARYTMAIFPLPSLIAAYRTRNLHVDEVPAFVRGAFKKFVD